MWFVITQKDGSRVVLNESNLNFLKIRTNGSIFFDFKHSATITCEDLKLMTICLDAHSLKETLETPLKEKNNE